MRWVLPDIGKFVEKIELAGDPEEENGLEKEGFGSEHLGTLRNVVICWKILSLFSGRDELGKQKDLLGRTRIVIFFFLYLGHLISSV